MFRSSTRGETFLLEKGQRKQPKAGWQKCTSRFRNGGEIDCSGERAPGYIERGDSLPGDAKAFKVARFVEKPTEDEARAMIATGRVYWNVSLIHI